MHKPIYNGSGKCIGFLIEAFDKTLVSNPSMKNLGWYSKSMDKTFNSSGKLIGKGNLLSILLEN